MKRPALYIGIPYALGLLIASKFDILSWGVILLTAFGILLYRRAVWKYVLLSTLSCLIACCHHEDVTGRRQADFAGREIVFSGQITEKTAYSSGYANYVLKGIIQEYDVSANIELFIEDDTLSYGDTVTVSGIPKLISSSYLFDSERYTSVKNIFLRFEADTEILEIQPLEKETLRSIIYHWRERMKERILSHMDTDTGAMLTAMLFGDKSSLDYSAKTALYRTGIGHILAVSGLHLDFLALCVSWILEQCKAGRKFSFLIIMILCGLFVICAGETVSVKRACIMILLSQSAKLFFRQANSFNSLSIAVLILCLENPFVIHSAAFWLSCSGAFGIGVLANFMTKGMKTKTPEQKFLKNMIAFFWVFVAVLPASVLYFREVSLISPLSNALIVPLCMVSMLIGVLGVVTGGSQPFAEILFSADNSLNHLILKISNLLAGQSWTHASSDSEVLLFVLYSGVMLVICCQIFTRNKKFTSISVILVMVTACISVNIENFYQSGDLKIAVLGSAKNCLLAVRQGSDALLIDITGESYAPNYGVTYLEQSGVRTMKNLYLCSPKAKSIQRYDEYLTFFSTNELWLLKETEQKMPDLSSAKTYLTDEKELLFHGAKIRISQKQVEISYADRLCLCTNESTEISGIPDILTVYGKSQNILPECGLLLILDENTCYLPDSHTYVNENNLEITISKNGSCRVRRLYGDSE